MKFFAGYDGNLYEAPGDPSPGSPGVWLGSDVTPTACFEAGRGATSATDADGDGLAQSCEFAIARSFSPILQYYQGENCAGGEPHWAAKRFPNGVVRLGYMFAYYDDCGYYGHTGDSEFVSVDVFFNSSTQHWEFVRMWLSAHDKDTDWYSHWMNRSEWVFQSETEFPLRHLAAPKVYVASRKHANYKSISSCHWSHGNSSYSSLEDWCGNDSIDRIRFPVKSERNAGSRYVYLVPCGVRSVNKTSSTRSECFYGVPLNTTAHGFQGWYETPSGDYVGNYHGVLFRDYHFENYCDMYFGGCYTDY